MTAVATPTEVFDFAGTDSTQRTAKTSLVTTLIEKTTQMIEDYIGRYIIPQLATIKIHNGRYCSIAYDKIYLDSKYYDPYSISELKEDDVILTEDTDFVKTKPNILERIDEPWSQTDQLNIEITGYFGMGYSAVVSEETVYYPHKGLKEILIEAVAVQANIWSRIVDDGSGNSFEIMRNSLPNFSKDSLYAYRQRPVL